MSRCVAGMLYPRAVRRPEPMTVTHEDPTTPRRHRGRQALLVIWLIALGVIVVLDQLSPLLNRIPGVRSITSFISFLAWLLVIALALYGCALVVRWLMRKLFWRVGRRLFLSYILVGVLPFFLMATMFLAVGYMIAGVMSQAALRGSRQATLGQMESWALEYGLTGRKPKDALPTLEVYDTANESGAKIPEWLRQTTFSGIVTREDSGLLVASRQFETAGKELRTVVFAQPLDRLWAAELEELGGMIARPAMETRDDARGSIQISTREGEARFEGPEDFNRLVFRSLGRKIIWGDMTEMSSWADGKTEQGRRLFTLIINPASNIFQFYFGGGPSSSTYLDALVRVTIGLGVMLFVIYLVAAMFAAILIFSISRAVNRIEKGTKAVERGDFSYRIRMKPHNQLGEMAQSFDRMTESIASLLSSVAEKERLQSEIAIAAEIQRNLLPKSGPLYRGVSFSAHFEPTASIGGDYYDVFNLDKSRLAVAIGDVSGHGLSTGLVMAMVKAAITTLVEEGAEEIALFHRLNDLVFRSTERRAFMTLAFTIFDLEKRTIRHTNAGHLFPYLLREGSSPISIESPSLPLGVRSTITTQTVEIPLEEGDTIVYLSDGIVETQNENGDPLGFEELERMLAGEVDRNPTAMRDKILDTVARHSGNRPADDDRTVMIIRFDSLVTALSHPMTEADREPVTA
jgi:sigma-B regulation protein RsbU (phosphoserine phosphatase)